MSKKIFFLFWNSFNDLILNLFQYSNISSGNQEFWFCSILMIHSFVCISSIFHLLLLHSLNMLTCIAQTWKKMLFKISCRDRLGWLSWISPLLQRCFRKVKKEVISYYLLVTPLSHKACTRTYALNYNLEHRMRRRAETETWDRNTATQWTSNVFLKNAFLIKRIVT